MTEVLKVMVEVERVKEWGDSRNCCTIILALDSWREREKERERERERERATSEL